MHVKNQRECGLHVARDTLIPLSQSRDSDTAGGTGGGKPRNLASVCLDGSRFIFVGVSFVNGESLGHSKFEIAISENGRTPKGQHVRCVALSIAERRLHKIPNTRYWLSAMGLDRQHRQSHQSSYPCGRAFIEEESHCVIFGVYREVHGHS